MTANGVNQGKKSGQQLYGTGSYQNILRLGKGYMLLISPLVLNVALAIILKVTTTIVSETIFRPAVGVYGLKVLFSARKLERGANL